MKLLSSSAQKIQSALNTIGSGFTVIEFEDSTRTAQEAADRVHCQLGQIVKSLVFLGKTSGKGVLILTSGVNRVDEKKVGLLFGEPIGRADADFVRSLTGFSIGGVPPMGHPQPIETFIDEDLLQYPTVWAAAGTPARIFEISPTELTTFTNGKVAAIKQN